MEPIRKQFNRLIVKDAGLTDRQVRAIASDPTPDRVGDVMVPDGCDATAFNDNPIVLFNHDHNRPIATADIKVSSRNVTALINFPPTKISPLADECCGLAKSGVLNAVSVGFNPVDYEQIPGGGKRYTKWELFELSIVSIPANPSALIVERSLPRLSPRKREFDLMRDLTPQERAERKQRDVMRREGAFLWLTEQEWALYLDEEFPHLATREAREEHNRRFYALSVHEKFLDRKKRSDFAKGLRRAEEIRLRIRNEIRGSPPLQPEKRYQPVTAADWCAEVRAEDEERFRDAARKWRH
jgi:HK97 family phage prohead protease